MSTYSRSAACSNGHPIVVSFDWDPNRTTEGPRDYSEACPVPGCAGQVAGKLPIGADPASLRLTA